MGIKKREIRLCSKCFKKVKMDESFGTDGKDNWWHLECNLKNKLKESNAKNNLKENFRRLEQRMS